MKSRAASIASMEEQMLESLNGRSLFSVGNRPVIRWIKGEGMDDEVTRSAIGQATRIFGNEVDYCICTNHLEADRVRYILELAVCPVEWIKLTAEHNHILAHHIIKADCTPDNFGYWWKWFPSIVRPDAPEWILDGDMVLVGKPSWYEAWKDGKDVIRVSQDNRGIIQPNGHYGRYHMHIDERKLYSGIISLPPSVDYMPYLDQVLKEFPLSTGHDGRTCMDEQGIIAMTFQLMNATPIPLYEFPFGRAFEDFIDYGLEGNIGNVWGYHFGNAFRRENLHYVRLVNEGAIFTKKENSITERFQWLGNFGQWGIPGWSMSNDNTQAILDIAKEYSGKKVLELGTARGRMTAMLEALGCHVTTIDKHDRGAKQNLSGMNIQVIVKDAREYLAESQEKFDLIIADVHDNSYGVWKPLWDLIKPRVDINGEIIISNALLYKVKGWEEETGVKVLLDNLESEYFYHMNDNVLPGIVIIKHINSEK